MVIGFVVGVVTRDEVCSLEEGKGHDLLEIELAPSPEDALPAVAPSAAEPSAAAPSAAGRRRAGPALRCLVPFVPSIVPAVDLAGQVLWLDPPAGLLDLARPRHQARARIRGVLAPRAESLIPCGPRGG
jgi:hypothetical protein